MTNSSLRIRRGFTLAEMVVALLLFSVVGGGILTLVMRQQRFYRSTSEIIKVQGQLRQGASVLPLDLRAISTSDVTVNSASTRNNADVYSRSDWHIEFRRVFGSSLICGHRAAAPFDTITLLPKQTSVAAALTSWSALPVAGDSILLLDEGRFVGAGDDRWVAYEVRSVQQQKGVRGCPWKTATDSTPVLFAADTNQMSFKLAISPTLTNAGGKLTSTIPLGSPVRFFRRVRYEIYQAPDELWYLGYSDCLPSYGTWNGCSEVTPIAGPYQPYTGITSENGIVFRYYDGNGAELASTDPSSRIARIDVTMRAVTATAVTRTGAGVPAQYRDSVVLTVGIRNRR